METIIDPDKRRLLLLAGATAASAVLSSSLRAAASEATLGLEAQAVTTPGGGAASRLSYRPSVEVPVLRMAKEGILRVTLKNTLAEPTAIDWHGLRPEKALDVLPGLTDAPLAPGASTTLDVKTRESGTFWFHPPFVPGWSDQTARGLAGVLIVEETAPPAVEDDVVLFLADRSEPTTPDLSGRLTLNGKPWPETKTYAPGARLRLRLVNGSTRQALSAAFENARVMVIAIDGQPSDLFRPLKDTLPIGPGARFDVLVDMPHVAGQDVRLMLRDVGEAGVPSVAPAFIARADGTARPEGPPMAALAPNPRLPPAIPLEKAMRIDLVVRKAAGGGVGKAAFAINGLLAIDLPKTPLFKARRSGAVTIGLLNTTADLVGFRLHGQAMRLLHALDDGWEPYWRDAVLVSPGKSVHVAFVPDTAGRWLIDSPFFGQATSGLRRWFEVT